MTRNLHIHRVPPQAVPQAIRVPECARLMARGLRAAGETDTPRVVAELVNNRRQLWLVFAPGNPALLACWTTEIKEDNCGARWVCVSALAGTGMLRWVRLMADGMVAWAATQGCVCVRWAGKPGWRRAVPSARQIGSAGGQSIFERAVA